MVDPITVGTGLMVAVSAARKALETADDLSSIGNLLDSVFKAEAKEEEKKKVAEQLSHNQKAVTQRIGADSADVAGVELAEVASARVRELEHAEALKKLGRQLDTRFGYGTWTSIQEEFKQKAALAKKKIRQDAELKREKEEARKERNRKILLEIGKVIILVGALGVLALYLWWAMQKGGN